MTKGAYEINETNVGPTKDGSFRSMLCAMLVFVSICGIILIVAWPWRNSGSPAKLYSGNSAGTAAANTGNKIKPSNESKDDKVKQENTPKSKPEDKHNTNENAIDKPHENPDESVELFTEKTVTDDKSKLSTTDSSKKRENIVVVTIPSTTTTTASIRTTSSFVNNSKQTTEKTALIEEKVSTVKPGETLINNTEKNKTQDKIDKSEVSTTKSPNHSISTESVSVSTTPSHANKDEVISVIFKNSKEQTEKPENDTKTLTSDDETTTLSTITSTQKETMISKKDEVISVIHKDSKEQIEKSGDAPTTLTPDNETTTLPTITSTQKETINLNKYSKTQIEISDDATTILTPDDETTTLPTTSTQKEIIISKKHEVIHKDSKEQTDKSKDDTTTLTPDDETTTLPTITSTQKEIIISKKHGVIHKDSKEQTDKSKDDTTTLTPDDETTTLPTITSTQKETINLNKHSKTQIGKSDDATTILTPDDETTTLPTITSTQKETINLNKYSKTQIGKSDDATTILTPDDETTTLPTITSTQKETINLNKHSKTQIEKSDDATTTLAPDDETTTLPTTSTQKEIIISKKHEVIHKDSKEQTDKSEDATTPLAPDDETTTLPTTSTQKEIIISKNHEVVYKDSKEQTDDETTTFPTTTSTQKEIMETENVDQRRRITEPPTNLNQNTDECKAECREVGARILSRMNHFADPCEQFYDYACGSDNSDNAPEDNWKRIADALDRIHLKSPDAHKTFQKFYESCVDFHTDYNYGQRIFEAKDLLATVGQPFEDGGDEDSALTDLLTRLLQLDSSPLFDISVDVDQDKHFIFQLNIGKRFSTLQNDNSVTFSKRKCMNKAKRHLYFSSSPSDHLNLNEMQEVYLNCMKNETYMSATVEEALIALDLDVELEHSIEHVEKIIEIYKQLPSVASIREDMVKKQFVIRKVSELEFHYPLIKWNQLLTNLVGKPIDGEDLVQVYFKDFFFTMFSRKQTLTIPELYNAILTMYIHDLYANLVLPTPMKSPEEFCLHQSSDLMKEVASSLYLESIKKEEYEGDLNRVNELFSKMKTTLQDMIQKHAEWLNSSPKISLTKKLNNMVLDTVWDQSLLWKNTTLVEERMESINRTYGNYSDFAAALVRRNRQMLYDMWDTMGYVENNVWWHFLTPYSTDPKSIYALNKIAIPPAMLLTNSKDIPRYLSLAKLGYSLAKAVGYHFDSTGSKYEMNLDSKAQAAYKEAEICTKPYNFNDMIEVEHDGKNLQFKVNDDSFKLTINERFIEDMAIHLLSEMTNDEITDYQISWIASNSDLAKTFTRERMFFIALGQEHCRKSSLEDYFLHVFESEHLPSSLVLNIALSHSTLFKDVFHCKDGSRLNAELKCKAFPVWEEPDDPDQYNDYNI